ncbi:synaptonemal complex protein 1 [Seriola lalandi dorsalis]|uniref:synaptonemal complex protein 1 n=1 Tax=Seriola lalandi dorsalis TaxID=1841481 RepID=UPI000C6F88C8|nr:synaptonemal complex protein 1 [Seriola lalandi dorsalis]
MERNQGFNFKLLVPPRLNNGQGYSRCFDKGQNMPFPNTSLVTPTKPIRQDFPNMKVVPPMEKDEKNCNPGQLCSKLFEEVEKMKCWKVKVDSDTVQKERRLQENKRTIETQRKAIQELQFGNENLSIKLEEQISENEDLRNKNNATRNLCNILKDTFQRSAKNMQLFESEREETHHLVMENSESIQKLIAAFESLRILAEADQQEMQKVKEGLLQFEELKKKYCQENAMKEEEVAGLQMKLKNTESELEKVLLDLHETQKHCKQLQDTTNQQNELLKSSKAEQESLLQKLHTAEQSYEETQIKVQELEAELFTEIKKNKEHTFQMEQLKNDITLHKVKYEELLSNFNELQSEKMAIQQQFESESSNVKAVEENMKVSEEKAVKLTREIQRLKEENQCLREEANSIKTKIQEKIQETETRHKKMEENYEHLQEKITEKEKQIKAVETKVQKIKLAAAEAIKNKGDAERKCQHKIADMVALMEKHKYEHLQEKITEKEKQIKAVETKGKN